MKLIAIAGLASSGKDSTATFLNSIGFQRYAFADEVKRLMLILNPAVGISGGVPVRLKDLVGKVGWDQAKQSKEVRELLQRFATDICRNEISDSIWIQKVADDIVNRNPKKVVITDLRFQNEAEWVKRMGGENWIVVRPDIEPIRDERRKIHESEQLRIPSGLFDMQVVNDGTLDDLKRQVLNFGNTYDERNKAT